MQCRLLCDPGYISDITPLFECTGGQYQPIHPTLFKCEPAVALLVSDIGEREILSAEDSTMCDKLLTTIPNKEMSGHSINLLDNHLILGATTIKKNNKWKYLSLSNPRAGLLTNKWTGTLVKGQNAPKNHVTFTFDKNLLYFGGDFKAQSLLQNGRGESGEWTLLKLLNRQDNQPFDTFTSHACSAKLDRNRFLVFGGTYTSEQGEESVLADVFEVDIFDKQVQKLGEMKYARTQHACSMIPKRLPFAGGRDLKSQAVLISGGVGQTNDASSIVRVVELFLLDRKKSIELTNEMLEPRFKHRMIQLGTDLLALGGEAQDGMIKSIEKFNFENYTNFNSFTPAKWTAYPKSLKSNSTSSLAVTTLPMSAVECNKEEPCECGKPRGSRIIGGTEVQTI